MSPTHVNCDRSSKTFCSNSSFDDDANILKLINMRRIISRDLQFKPNCCLMNKFTNELMLLFKHYGDISTIIQGVIMNLPRSTNGFQFGLRR